MMKKTSNENLKLKGVAVKSMKPATHQKATQTLQHMSEVRQKDNTNLRDKTQSLIKDYDEQRYKRIEIIKRYNAEIEKTQTEIIRLEGAVLALNNLLGD